MAYINIHASLGWINDERSVSHEVPDEEWDQMSEAEKEEFAQELIEESVWELVDVWTTVTEEEI